MNFRDNALENAKQQIRSLEIKLDSLSAQHLKEKEEWGLSLQNVEETWRSNTHNYLVKSRLYLIFIWFAYVYEFGIKKLT